MDRRVSLFAALLLSVPASARQTDHNELPATGLADRIERAKGTISAIASAEVFQRMTQRGDEEKRGVIPSSVNEQLAYFSFANFQNFQNFRNFQNFQNFRNFSNFQNFRNFQNFQNFHNFQNFRNVQTFHNFQNAPVISRPQFHNAPVYVRPQINNVLRQTRPVEQRPVIREVVPTPHFRPSETQTGLPNPRRIEPPTMSGQRAVPHYEPPHHQPPHLEPPVHSTILGRPHREPEGPAAALPAAAEHVVPLPTGPMPHPPPRISTGGNANSPTVTPHIGSPAQPSVGAMPHPAPKPIAIAPLNNNAFSRAGLVAIPPIEGSALQLRPQLPKGTAQIFRAQSAGACSENPNAPPCTSGSASPPNSNLDNSSAGTHWDRSAQPQQTSTVAKMLSPETPAFRQRSSIPLVQVEATSNNTILQNLIPWSINQIKCGFSSGYEFDHNCYHFFDQSSDTEVPQQNNPAPQPAVPDPPPEETDPSLPKVPPECVKSGDGSYDCSPQAGQSTNRGNDDSTLSPNQDPIQTPLNTPDIHEQ